MSSLAISTESEPEPEIAVVPVAADDYEAGHPAEAYLVVDVSTSSLDKDRSVKSQLYAGAGIAEYWIVNLVDRQIEVRTKPSQSGYESVVIRRAGDTIALVEFADTDVEVADVLPET